MGRYAIQPTAMVVRVMKNATGAVMQQIAVSASSPRQVPKSEESFASGIRQQQPPTQMITSPTNRSVHVIAAFSSFA